MVVFAGVGLVTAPPPGGVVLPETRGLPPHATTFVKKTEATIIAATRNKPFLTNVISPFTKLIALFYRIYPEDATLNPLSAMAIAPF
jgi:hypothetical protein